MVGTTMIDSRPSGRRPDSPVLSVTQAQLEAQRGIILASPKSLEGFWKRGELWWLLDANQLATYHLVRAAIAKPRGSYLLDWGRRVGKSFLAEIIILEQAIRHQGQRYNVVASTKESLQEIVWPTLSKILASCPSKLRPRIGDNEMVLHGHLTRDKWTIIKFAGCNDRRAVERLRGQESWGNLYEEAGAFPDDPGLAYIRREILNPFLLTTGGWNLTNGTPPPNPDHEYDAELERAEANGDFAGEVRASRRTLYDNPRLTPEQITTYLAADAREAGMTVEKYLESDGYKREWLALRIRSRETMAFPDLTDELLEELTQQPKEFRLYQRGYTGGDYGYSPDPAGLLVGWYDDVERCLWIAKEAIIPEAGGTEMAAEGKRLEADVFGAQGKPAAPGAQRADLIRVFDAPEGMLSDMAKRDGYHAGRPRKEDKDASISDVRRAFLDKRIRFVVGSDGKCQVPMLRKMLRACRWNKQHTEFVRSHLADDEGRLIKHHFELVDDLLYMWRRVLEEPEDRAPRSFGLRQPDQAMPLEYLMPRPETSETGWGGAGWEGASV